jgi:hypothetical protein
MFNWFWKWLGYHVCEEWTQWQTFRANYVRLPLYDEVLNGVIVGKAVTEVEYTKKWQERWCTICGKVQQEKLDN